MRLQRLPALVLPFLQPLDVTPRPLAGGGGVPGTPMTLDRLELGRRALRALAVHQGADGRAPELLGQMTEPARVVAAIARQMPGRGGPEHALDDPGLEAHHRAGGQERVEQRAMAAHRVHAQDEGQAGPPPPPYQRQPPRLGLDDSPLAAVPALAHGMAARLRLGPGSTIPADAREITAGSRILPCFGQGVLDRLHVRLYLADRLEV